MRSLSYHAKLLALILVGVASLTAQQVELKLDIFIEAPTIHVIGAVDRTTLIPYPDVIALGDGRGPGAAGSSRVVQTVTIDTQTLAHTVNPPVIGESTSLFLGHGLMPDAYRTGTADSSAVGITVVQPTLGVLVVNFHGNPSNPTTIAPGITYSITAVYNQSTGGWSVSYTTDKFPSFRLTADNQELLYLKEHSVYDLIPGMPTNTSDPVTVPGSVYGGSPLAYNNWEAFANFTGRFVTWGRGNTANPSVKIGQTVVIEYTDPSTGQVISY